MFKAICPRKCCAGYDEECKQYIDNTGQAIIPDEEIMLIYGGITNRERYINGTLIPIFDQCEYYDEKFNLPPENRPFNLRNCGEEILGDLWRYHIKRNVWTFIKIDYNPSVYASIKAPTARYGHAGSYVEMGSSEELLGDEEVFIRKYMYMYGGFSYLCTTACYDLWRYEIPYIPLSMAPSGKSMNPGNHWE